jgi:hypothetical protein
MSVNLDLCKYREEGKAPYWKPLTLRDMTWVCHGNGPPLGKAGGARPVPGPICDFRSILAGPERRDSCTAVTLTF